MKRHFYVLILLFLVFISVFESFNEHAADPDVATLDPIRISSEVPILKIDSV